ncbi:hypothetical protein C8A00DRAFT_45034 [Chaetomidium leptoderma]|uniref:Ubiquitin 3 binding protein But2 C-terminal domain-containing protein n=1 Tax=Chaetomidium leptoderma TaxID=669021 RepID=A0AAN6VHS6_9PEZI|nr:hypothetical protein C8A00DRAFT_45034 [Chaetomidium leptoderma]
MKFTLAPTTLLALLATTLTTTTAIPVPAPLNTNTLTPRTCPHVHPLATPRLNLVNRPDLGVTTTQTLLFTLPSTAPGTPLPGPCTLRAVFPPHWEVIDTSVQKGGEPLAVNVFAVDGPAAGALVGVVRFGSSSSSAGNGERVVTVNSFACRERMAYRFELAGVGEVGFVNGLDQGLGVEGGLEMAWGC